MRKHDISIVRRCKTCRCLNTQVRFLVSKDSKSGRYYTHNKCIPCRREEIHFFRLKRKQKDPKHDSRTTMEWRKRNISKWRRYHSKWQRDKRIKSNFMYSLPYSVGA